MNIYNVPIEISTYQQIVKLLPLEAHYSRRKMGNGFCLKTWNEVIKRLKTDKFCYAIFPGDIRDTGRPSARERREYMFHEYERKPALTEEDENDQYVLDSTIIKDLKPVAHKIIGMLDGDHFVRYADGSTSTQYLCEKLGIPGAYLGERLGGARMTFRMKHAACSLNILARHGVGGTGRIGSDINRLISQNEQFRADLYIGGHTHKKWFYPMNITYFGKYELKNKVIGYARAGSMLRSSVKGQVLYNEIAEMSPLKMGYPEIYIYLKRSPSNNDHLEISDIRGLT